MDKSRGTNPTAVPLSIDLAMSFCIFIHYNDEMNLSMSETKLIKVIKSDEMCKSRDIANNR